MPAARGHRFTIYDALDAAGVFEANPANTYARDATTGTSLFKGAVEYPKMMYHPTGDTDIIRAGEVVVNPLTGPAMQNEHREIINRVVASKEEEEELAAEGWHTHPALAIKARVEARIEADQKMSEAEKKKLRAAIPQISSDDRIRQLEKQLEEALRLRDGAVAERDSLEPQTKPSTPGFTPPALQPVHQVELP